MRGGGVLLQALGHLDGSHSEIIGEGWSLAAWQKHTAIAGKKQSASTPTWKVRALSASLTRRRPRSPIMPGSGWNSDAAQSSALAIRTAAGPESPEPSCLSSKSVRIDGLVADFG